MSREPTTYWDYIRVEDLLGLQGGRERDEKGLANDEVLFIVVHQIDELWFKVVLRELLSVRDLFAKEHVPEQALSSAVRGLRRAELLMRQVAQHFQVMETLTTRDYLAFRDKLNPASGFQSAQLREIEILLGLSDDARIPLGHEGSYMAALRQRDGSPSPASKRVEARLSDKPTLLEAIETWAYRTPIDGSMPGDPNDAEKVASFVSRFADAHAEEGERIRRMAEELALTPDDANRLGDRYAKEARDARSFLMAHDAPEPERARRSRVRAALVFIESYRELPLLAWPREVLDVIVALEQAFVIFRQRHARMVERVIGRRTGTGGSAGVEYLDKTALTYRIFKDVWAVRSLLLREAALPPLEQQTYYGFESA